MKSAITIIEKIASNILIALYQPFWFAVISSVLILFFYTTTVGSGTRNEG